MVPISRTKEYKRNQYIKYGRAKARAKYLANRETILAKNKEKYKLKPKPCKRYKPKSDGTRLIITAWRNKGIKFDNNEEAIYWANLVKDPDTKCQGCDRTSIQVNKKFKGKIIRLSLDHDHNTGKPRAVLCHRCNTIEGLIKDDSESRVLEIMDRLFKIRTIR